MRDTIKPRLGQHFLDDLLAQKRIVDALGDAAGGLVLEIGPGRAALTEMLATDAEKLIAVELDAALAAELRGRFAHVPSVEVVQADILTVDLARYAPGPRSLAVVGNLPYYITSPILQRLFQFEHLLSRAVVMVQREVGQRMAATPGYREYGLLSVLCQMHAETNLLFDLPPEAFSPPPDVDSSVLRMEFAPRWDELGVQKQPFTRFLEQSFAQKRKTLANNLKAADYANEAVSHALDAAKLSATARAEELWADQLVEVYRALTN